MEGIRNRWGVRPVLRSNIEVCRVFTLDALMTDHIFQSASPFTLNRVLGEKGLQCNFKRERI